jgi:phosphotriesterase-related protein
MDQLDIIEEEGYSPSRFISIHTQAEPDLELHKAIAGRGAWIEFDNAGWVPDEDYLRPVLHALEAGLGPQMLLSHDAGWYDPAKPGGGEPKPFTVLTESILPALRGHGIGNAMIGQLTRANPFNAYAR